MSGKCHDPDTCSSCGFLISEDPPAHNVSDGSIRQVCDRCWKNPCLFFLPREFEIHGTYPAIKEYHWRKYLGIPDSQTTLFQVSP